MKYVRQKWGGKRFCREEALIRRRLDLNVLVFGLGAKVVLARVIFGAVTRDSGWSEVTVIADDVVIGSPGNRIDKKVLDDFAAVFCQAGIPTRVSEERDIRSPYSHEAKNLLDRCRQLPGGILQ